MDRELPHQDEIWRHFKNKLYKIVAIAQHTETDEQLVVYVYFVSSSGYITEHSRPLQWSAIVLYKEISNFKSGIVSERIDLSDF